MFDGAEPEKAGDKGILSASVTATAIDVCLMEANILNSILKLCGLARRAAGQLAAAAALGVAGSIAQSAENCSRLEADKSQTNPADGNGHWYAGRDRNNKPDHS